MHILCFSSTGHTVRCLACFCDYLLYAGISILCSSDYICLGTLLLGTFYFSHSAKTTLRIHTHVLHDHYISIRIRPDHTTMTGHLRIAAHAFLQLSTGPPAMPIKSCREQALPRVSVCVSPVFRLPFVSVDVICPRRTLDGTSTLFHRRCTPSETAASD